MATYTGLLSKQTPYNQELDNIAKPKSTAAQTADETQTYAPAPPAPVAPAAPATPSPTAAPRKTAPDYINPATDTVEGRLTGFLSKDNEFTKLNETKARQWANTRGVLNSTMAAQAGRAAAIESGLPIASQDAQTYAGFGQRAQESDLQTGLNADEFAQQRAMKQYEQQTLAYTQLIQGVSEINKQDMSMEAKKAAVQNLWDIYQRGSAIGTSLSGVQIQNGRVIWPEGEPSPPSEESTQEPVTTNTSTPEKAGNTEDRIKSVVDYVDEKFKDYITSPKPFSGGAYSTYTGYSFGSDAAKSEYEKLLKEELSKAGLPTDEKTVAKSVGYNQRQESARASREREELRRFQG